MSDQTSSGWKWDGRGRAYWQDEAGRHVHVRPEEFKHNSLAIDGASTQPSVVAGHYKPYAAAKSNSWPKRSQPSYLSEKLMGRNRPHFGDGASQQSGRPDVDHPARQGDVAGVTRPNASTDVYRDAKKSWGKEGPTTSTYDKQYYEYKEREDETTRFDHEYKAFVGAPKPSLAEIHRNKDIYGGYPMQKQEWHEEACQKAASANQAAAGLVEGRREYAKNYIGYHQPSYHPGHKQAADEADKKRAELQKATETHRSWEPLQAQIDRNRQEKAARKARR